MAHSGGGLNGAEAASIAGEDLFASLPVAALLIDPDECVARANAAAEHLLNQSERAMKGQRLDRLIEPPSGYADRRPGLGFAAFDADIRIRRGADIRADFVEGFVADRPEWRIVTLHHAPAGRRMGYGIDRSAGARAAIGAAAMLAHEIKNPLSGIRGAAQLLAAGVDQPEELTSLITAEVDRVAALIDRMEDFTDTRPLELRAQSIYPLLAHARSLAEAGFASDIEIVEDYDPSLPPALLDRDAFLQVVLNLIKNAAEALDGVSDPRITISTAFRHGMSVSVGPGHPRRPLPIEITISDNGPGAPADIAEHLFEPFVSGKPEGKGLGLPLVDKLIRDMGGIVHYQREPTDPPTTEFHIFLARA
ncbi:MAG: two-component sensor histidine kinase [Sphingomonas sp.]|nr:two-component sensor histidine kinase [Sphingomonas sp.]